MTSDNKSIAIVAVGAALAGAAVGATIVARAKSSGAASAASKKVAASSSSTASSSSSASSSPFPLLPAAALSCVVFISDGAGEESSHDGSSTSSSTRGFNVKVARKASFFELRDAVVGASAGRLDGRSRLFVSVEGVYQELTPENARALLASAASAGGKSGAGGKPKPGEAVLGGDALIVLAATRDGADLSPEAASRPPPTPVPRGPRGLPFLGNALLFKGPHEVPGMNLYKNLFDPKTVRGRWGDTVRISVPVPSAAAAALEAEARVVDEQRSATETIVTSDPHILAELCAREADFPKMWNRPAQVRLQDFTGNGIFTSSSTSSDWIAAHGLLPRSFNAIKLDAMYPSVLDACRGFVRSLRSQVEKAGGGRARVDHFSDFLTALTADAVVKCAIGLDMRNVARLSRGEAPHPFIPAFRFGLKYASGGADASDLPASVRLNPFVSNAAALADKYEEAKRTCTEIVDDMIERTRLGELCGCGGDSSKAGINRVDNASSASSPSNGNTSVLATMLNDRAPNGQFIRLGAIQGHVLNLMIAGHETTAATLGFVIFYLSRHPEWEARVVEEARAVLAGRTEPAASDLRKLVVTEAVFREALRLHPPVVALTRDASADTTLAQGKYVVRRGQRVLLLLPALHRRDDVWGSGSGYPDPETFDPSRFLPGDERAKNRPPLAFSPWGFGQRACIGSQFALMEAKCLLCLLYSQLCLGTPEGYVAIPSTVEGGAAPVPKGLSVLLYPRAGAPEVAAAAAEEEAKAAAAASSSSDAAAAPPSAPASSSAAAPAPAAAHSIPLRILYGSNGGTCEAFASSLAQRAAQLGFAATAEPLDAAADGSLAAEGGSTKGAAVAIITATYNGMPPDNAAKFMKWLASLESDGKGGENGKEGAPLSNLHFACFGVGNSQWALTYLKVAKAIDVGLAAAGGQRVRAFEGADVDGAGAADAFDDWATALLEGVQAAAGIEGGAASSSAGGKKSSSSGPPPRVKLEMLPAGTPALSSAAEVVRQARKGAGIDSEEFAAEGYHPLKVTAATQLLSASSPAAAPAAATAAASSAPQQQQRATVHLEVELPPGLSYQAGDHFELIPRNAAPLVDSALELVGLRGDEPVAWTPVNVAGARGGPARGIVAAGRAAAVKASSNPSNEPPEGAIEQQPVTARAALEYLADLSAPCSRKLVAALAAAAQCPPEAAALRSLASDDGYASGVALPRLSLVDLLSRFRSVDARAALGGGGGGGGGEEKETDDDKKPPLEAFVNAHPRLVPRYYSISSSPKARENRATITVGLVQLIAKSGRQHRGPGSGLAHDARPGEEIVGTVRRLQSTFRYPSDRPETPVVMVGPGTGVAPMIGFLEEREALMKAGKKLGKAVLFFGCRGRGDFIFKERLEKWVESGVLTTLHVAMSREEDDQGRRGYVQDWIAKEAVNLWPLLEKEKGIVYVCGDARSMAPEVRRSFAGVAASAGGRSQAAAEAFVGAMLEGNRYLEDVWAG